MKNFYTAVSCFIATACILIVSSTANAGPLACAQAVASCGKGGKKAAAKIKKAREACEALRDCKNVCKDTKKSEKKSARKNKKSCLKKCDKKSGRAKRSCKSACKKEKRADFKDARGDKRDCMSDCREAYKTKACKKARREMSVTLAAQGLKCASKVTAQCVPPSP